MKKVFIHLLIASSMFVFHYALGSLLHRSFWDVPITYEDWKFYISNFLFFGLFFALLYKLYWPEYKYWIQIYFIVFAVVRNFFF